MLLSDVRFPVHKLGCSTLKEISLSKGLAKCHFHDDDTLISISACLYLWNSIISSYMSLIFLFCFGISECLYSVQIQVSRSYQQMARINDSSCRCCVSFEYEHPHLLICTPVNYLGMPHAVIRRKKKHHGTWRLCGLEGKRH